jgi:hypothetical protein
MKTRSTPSNETGNQQQRSRRHMKIGKDRGSHIRCPLSEAGNDNKDAGVAGGGVDLATT